MMRARGDDRYVEPNHRPHLAVVERKEQIKVNFWEFLLWIFWIYVLIACIWIFITVIIDIFRDPSLNGWAKALWVIFLVFLPFLAAFIYLIARGKSMTERRMAEAAQAQAAQNSYIREVGGRIAHLRDRVGQEAARLRRDHAGGVRCAQGQGARGLTTYAAPAVSSEIAGAAPFSISDRTIRSRKRVGTRSSRSKPSPDRRGCSGSAISRAVRVALCREGWREADMPTRRG